MILDSTIWPSRNLEGVSDHDDDDDDNKLLSPSVPYQQKGVKFPLAEG